MKHPILPGRTSGASPRLTAPHTTPGVPPRHVPIENVSTPRQRVRIEQHEGVLVEPTIGGERGVVVVYLDGHRWGLPNGVRIAPGKDVLYVCGVGGKITVLVGTAMGVQELQIDLQLAREIRKTYFQR